MDKVMEVRFSEQQHSIINRREVWHYLIDTPIGEINIVQYERPDLTIKRFLFDGGYNKAEEKYRQICRGLISEKL